MIADQECANHNSNGSCLGAIIDDDLMIRKCCPKPKCLLGTRGVRCEYFEQCVMPMGRTSLSPLDHEEWDKAIREYKRAGNVPGANRGTICKRCGKRAEPRRQYCYICAEWLTREKKRLYAQSARSGSRVEKRTTLDA